MFNPEIKAVNVTSDKSGDYTIECGGSSGCYCYSSCYNPWNLPWS